MFDGGVRHSVGGSFSTFFGVNILSLTRLLSNVEHQHCCITGAQSGGVVTFEPSTSSSSSASQSPVLRGIRSRVVNAKRTDLSKGVRAKIETDNASVLSNKLRGWNGDPFNCDNDKGRLVRGFFGHTRFATSSKASFDGTHPHQWSPRAVFSVFPFQSSSASSGTVGSTVLAPKSQDLGVENFITHNGDFEFYKINGKYYDTEAIQQFLVKALRVPMPATVDSAAIAGMMDLLRCQGCFALSARYALSFELGGSSARANPMDPSIEYPTIEDYKEIGAVFEKVLTEFVAGRGIKSLEDVSASEEERAQLVMNVKDAFQPLVNLKTSALSSLASFVSFDVESGDLAQFIKATVDAFFDNDLLHTMRTFLENAKGSFGLCVTTTLDAHRQVCFAVKGQTLSVAFYPRKGVICYGSEQAAVKAGLNFETPKGSSNFGSNFKSVDEDAVRLDLDDLGGEICLLDWGYKGDSEPSVSPPNRTLVVDKVMGGAVNVVLLHQENAMKKSSKLHKRLVRLENNEFIKPLLNDSDDPVLSDITDIPRVCANIQEDWQDVGECTS